MSRTSIARMYHLPGVALLALCALGQVATAQDANHAGTKSNSAQAKSAQAKGANRITAGPILGRLSHDGIGIWVRTARPGAFEVRYAEAPLEAAGRKQKSAKSEGEGDQAAEHRTTRGETRLENDSTGWVHLRDLQPDTRYRYEVSIAGMPSQARHQGTFRTLPDGQALIDPQLNPRGLFNFRFEFACGNNQSLDHGGGPDTPAFKTMLDQLHDKIHFSILNGDWLYENDARAYPVEKWQQQLGIAADETPNVVQVAPTIVGVWENYKDYLKSKNLSNYHRHVPTFFTFDDHEILNDVWGAGTPGLRDRRAVFRDIGVAAWYDYLGWSNPVPFPQGVHFGKARLEEGSDILTDLAADFSRLDLKQANNLHVHWGEPTAGVNDNALDGVGGDPNAGVYRIVKVLDKNRVQIAPAAKAAGTASYSIGRRSYYRLRIANCDFFVLDTRSQREMHDTTNPAKKGLSMLGPEQRQWLLEGVAGSDADFIFVVSSVNFMVPHVGGGAVRTTNKDDAWTVFFDERETLIQAFDKLGKPVFILTGDLHNSFVIKITDRVWEFASGPHNSNNHWASDEGDRPATGPFKYGPRACDIRWSTYFRTDIPREHLQHPTYCVVQVNNVFNNPQKPGEKRWVAFERPQVVFQYFDGKTGELRYAEGITAEQP